MQFYHYYYYYDNIILLTVNSVAHCSTQQLSATEKNWSISISNLLHTMELTELFVATAKLILSVTRELAANHPICKCTMSVFAMRPSVCVPVCVCQCYSPRLYWGLRVFQCVSRQQPIC